MRQQPVHHEDETPLAMVGRLARSGASGELVSASDVAEIHVYLLEGRVAWATSSTSRNAFFRHMVEQQGVAADALREVIDECQRTRKRFGETMVQWGVATLEQVREALAAQIGEAFVSLGQLGGARAIFLPRRMEYSAELTFDVSQFVADLDAVPETSASQARCLAESLLRALPEAAWTQLVQAGAAVASCSHPGAPQPGPLVLELAEVLAAERADALVLRSAYGALLGQQLDDRSSLWCAVRADAKLGLACSVLAAAAGRSGPEPAAAAEPGFRTVGSPGTSARLAPIQTAMRNADELRAGFLVEAQAAEPGGIWRAGEPAAEHAARLLRFQRLLQLPLRPVLERASESARFVAYDQPSARVTVDGRAYLGVVVPDPSPLQLWLVVDPAAPQGLGWALLQTAARQVCESGGA